MKAFYLGNLGDLGFGMWTCLDGGAVNIIGNGWANDIRDCQKLLAELAKTGGREATIEWRGDRWVAERLGSLDGWGMRLESAGDAAKLELAFLRDLAVMAGEDAGAREDGR